MRTRSKIGLAIGMGIGVIILVFGLNYWNQLTFCQNWASEINGKQGNVFSLAGEAQSYNAKCSDLTGVVTTHQAPSYGAGYFVIPAANAQMTNSTNATSQNFSMIQNEGNKLGNQLMCNLYPNSCSRNAP